MHPSLHGAGWLRALPSTLKARWRERPVVERAHLVLLGLITVGAVIHHVLLWHWYIEDAAISFAYARNWAAGEGLVPFPGGERVEGYSNPTWVALLAAFERLGWSAESSARWLQTALAAATVPLVYLLAREAAPARHSPVPLFAAALLGGNAQFAIWGGSGLENGLFNFLLAGALWRLAVEARAGGAPWSALWFFAVAISRPEAVGYAAIGGAGALVFSLHGRRGIAPVLRWSVLFFLPFFAYHAIRYAYFAWPWPTTYYGKLGDHRVPRPLDWDAKGWRYVRDWAHELGAGYLLPVFAQGMVGGRGWRVGVGVGLSTAVAVILLLPGDQRLLLPVILGFSYVAIYLGIRQAAGRPEPLFAWAGAGIVLLFVGAAEVLRAYGAQSTLTAPEWMQGAAPLALALAWVALPLVGAGIAGWQARWLCWGMFGFAIFFACYAMGDWMKGYRWLSLAAVPGSVLLACGIDAVAQMARAAWGRTEGPGWGRVGWAVALLLFGGNLAANVKHTHWFEGVRETTPYQVRHRVNHMQAAADRLHLDEPIVNLDVDQGAHLWWTGWRMLDIAGLIDVPMAQNRFRRPFLEEYLFEEQRPHFAHVHGGWARASRIPRFEAWKRDYVEIPGYPAGRQMHIGNHVRRDLFMAPTWHGPEGREVSFARGVRLWGWQIPSPRIEPGGSFYLEVGLGFDGDRSDADFRLLAFIAGSDALSIWELAVGYDWLSPAEWEEGELFIGRFTLPVPEDLPAGDYALGFVVLGPDGIWPAEEPAEPAAVAVGEHQAPGALRIGQEGEARQAAEERRARAIQRAAGGECTSAEQEWFLARKHLPDDPWIAAHEAETARALADCWVQVVEARPEDSVDALVRARRWDHRAPSVRRAVRPVAASLMQEGLAAREARDWEAAYRAFSDAVRVEPSRSWARRYAEEARAHRLGYDPATLQAEADRREEERARRQERAAGRKNLGVLPR